MSNEIYEPDEKTIAAEAAKIRNEGYFFDGQRRAPWTEDVLYKRSGMPKRELEFPVIQTPNCDFF